MRLLTTVSNSVEDAKAKHHIGLPPPLTPGKDTWQELGGASFLVIEENPDGVFLYRYSRGGDCVGDTWHMNVDDAKHQASYEYGESIKGWTSTSPEVEDAVAFGLQRQFHPEARGK